RPLSVCVSSPLTPLSLLSFPTRRSSDLLTALILLGVLFFLPKSRPDLSVSLKPKPILHSFWSVFRTRQFILYAVAGGLASSGMYASLSGSSFVMTELYGRTEKQYGWACVLITAGLITSSQLNSLRLRRFRSEDIAQIGVLVQSVVSTLMFVVAVSNLLSLTRMKMLTFCILACQGIVLPNTSALAINPSSKSS